MRSRLPETGEATGYGATYRRDLDAWVIYWMPGAVPLGVAVSGFNRRNIAEHLLGALRLTIKSAEEQSYASQIK